MIEKKIKIKNKAGFHVRPASTIVKMASKYVSEIYLINDLGAVNAKSIIGVMTFQAPLGSKVILQFEGKDEEPACKEVVAFFERGFDEL